MSEKYVYFNIQCITGEGIVRLIKIPTVDVGCGIDRLLYEVQK